METPFATHNLFMYRYVLPLFIGREVMKPTVVEGTAFSIGHGCFVTAAHCIREGMKFGWMALGTTNGQSIKVWNIDAWELVDDYDLALFHAEVTEVVDHFRWHERELPMNARVSAVGYPYALELDRNRMGIRSFTGHVVSATRFGRLPPDPPSYELSFQCPRGLSGAPLLVRDGDSMVVKGIVIGNHRTEMLVFTDREITSDTKEVVTERYEALQLGIALQSHAFLDLGPFKLLNDRTIREHLSVNELLSPDRIEASPTQTGRVLDVPSEEGS